MAPLNHAPSLPWLTSLSRFSLFWVIWVPWASPLNRKGEGLGHLQLLCPGMCWVQGM